MNFLTVKIPKDARVMLLEDSPMRITWFTERLPYLHVVQSIEELKVYFDGHPICDYFFLDHDLGEGAGTGVEAAEYINNRFGNLSSAGLIHSWNREGALRMQKVLPLLPWVPFGGFEIDYGK